MNPKLPPISKCRRTGLYCVAIPVAGLRRKKWISTGERSRARAKAVVLEAGVDRLVLLAHANTLTASAISVAIAGRRFTCRDILTAWNDELGTQLAPSTTTAYRVWIQNLLDQLGCWNKPIVWIKRNRLDEFVNDGRSKRSTCQIKLAALRSLYKFASAKAYAPGNIADTIIVKHREMTFEQKESRRVLPLQLEEYQTLQASPRLPMFWKRAVALGYGLGLRISDVATLEWASLRPDAVIVHTRKRDRRVELPFDDPLIGSGELRAVIGEMLIGPKEDATYCFPVERKIYLSKARSRLSQEFTRWARRHGIRSKSHHSCRHGFCTRLAEAGRTVESIGRLVGHTKPAVTVGYIHRTAAPESA